MCILPLSHIPSAPPPTHLLPSLFPLSLPLYCPADFPLSSFSDVGRSSLFPFEDGFLDDGHGDPSLTPGLNSPTRCQNGERMERYSRKVFVGGLPPDIDEGTSPPIASQIWDGRPALLVLLSAGEACVFCIPERELGPWLCRLVRPWWFLAGSRLLVWQQMCDGCCSHSGKNA